ncbi:MAG: FtsX-like permease family protein, partial [Bacteroidetes bacterium]|nr:FtsX-like permease family protein [Bacteroidota bacterium]
LTYEAESEKQDFYISAVIRDIPDNSHFEFDFLASFHSLETFMPWYNNWYYPPMYTYALTRATTDLVKLNDDVNNQMQISLPNWEKENRTYSVQKLGDIHLRSNLENEWKSNNRYEYVMIFWVIAIFILAIACINFINLATSKSIQRGREVGIRKVMGASRGRLVIQYLGESFLTTLISFLVAFGLTEWVLLVLFNKIAGIELGLDYLTIWPNWFYLGLSIFVIAFLAGFYPALILSRFKPAVILGSKSATVKESRNLRKGLVIFQFAISGFLIVGTFVVLNQVKFLQNKNLGFEKDLIVALKLNNDEDQQNVTKLKNQLLAYNFIDGVTVCSQLPVEGSPYDNPVEPENSNKEGGYNLYTLAVDTDFTKVFKMKIVEGRTFSDENEADKTSSILINQAAVKRFGWEQDDATGRNVKLTWFSDSAEVRDTRVIGVLENFHFNSLHHQIEPLIIYVNSHIYYTSYVAVRFNESQITSAVDFLNSEWKKYSPDRPADIQFLNDELAKKYVSESRVSKILSAFTLLAIIISCLGLLGLSAYSAEVRSKEIGIRKVLGASMSSILGMLSKEFMVLILISNLIALPIGWILARNWLQSFAYKAPLSTDIFLLAPAMALLIAFITVCVQSISAAISNPIKALRDE